MFNHLRYGHDEHFMLFVKRSNIVFKFCLYLILPVAIMSSGNDSEPDYHDYAYMLCYAICSAVVSANHIRP